MRINGRLILLVVVGSGLACTRTPKTAPPPSEPAKPVASVDADQILAEYQQNVLAADKKYKDQLVEVSGKFAKVGRGLMGDPYVSLGSDHEENAFGVTCYLTKSAEDDATKLKEGQMVKLRGICKGLYGGVALRFFNCEFVK